MDIDVIRAYAAKAHKGQRDKQGRGYVAGHLAPIAGALVPFGPEAEAGGWLHDVLEDVPAVSAADLGALGATPRVVRAVESVTRGEETYDELIARSCADPLGRIVKLVDNAWNVLNNPALAAREPVGPEDAGRALPPRPVPAPGRLRLDEGVARGRPGLRDARGGSSALEPVRPGDPRTCAGGLWLSQVMAARTYPDEPRFASPAEQDVWLRLRDALPGDALLLANLRLIDEDKDHEADLVVLLPGAGIVVLEVKGGSVWCEDGVWWQSGKTGKHTIHPVEQAASARYALRTYVEADPRWGSRGRVTWAHAVVAPYSDFPDDFALPDCPRWLVHGKGDLDDLVARLEETARREKHGTRAPDHDDLELISEIVRGRGFTGHDLNAEAAERQFVADRLTAEQATLLQVTRLLHRVEIRGGAGSGKTVLALAQARELTRGRAGEVPQRVALLCYSIGLGEFLKREVATWPRKHRPAFVGTYAELGRLWGAPDGDRADSVFWEEQLPAMMAELAAGLPVADQFDAFIVDEAQDFAETWWIPLLRALRDEEEGGLYVYSDENQRIFARFGHPPVPLVPLVLDHNLRNTKQIHGAFGPLAPTRMTARGGDGAEVVFLPAEDDPVDVADSAIEILLEAGWHPGNIALLTTGSRHPVQVELTEHEGQAGYWSSYWEDDVFYGHVLGCKGLERPAVVLCVNDHSLKDRATEKLYVGMSRATDHLIVVGDPDLVRDIGGPTVAARLGI